MAESSTKVYTDAEKVGFLTKSINNAIEKERNRYLVGYDLTSAQADVLKFVSYKEASGEEINQVDIEKEFNLSNPTVTGILKRLEMKGFVIKKNSQKDRRYKSVCLTEKAIEVYRKSSNNKSHIEEYLLRGIPEEHCKIAIDAMNAMLENMKELNATEFE